MTQMENVLLAELRHYFEWRLQYPYSVGILDKFGKSFFKAYEL